MTASVKFIDLRAIRTPAPIPNGTTLRYIGASCPAWQGLTGVVITGYSFGDEMWRYRVRIDEHTIETWEDCEVEVAS